jgi:hypothetical protein
MAAERSSDRRTEARAGVSAAAAQLQLRGAVAFDQPPRYTPEPVTQAYLVAAGGIVGVPVDDCGTGPGEVTSRHNNRADSSDKVPMARPWPDCAGYSSSQRQLGRRRAAMTERGRLFS